MKETTGRKLKKLYKAHRELVTKLYSGANESLIYSELEHVRAQLDKYEKVERINNLWTLYNMQRTLDDVEARRIRRRKRLKLFGL